MGVLVPEATGDGELALVAGALLGFAPNQSWKSRASSPSSVLFSRALARSRRISSMVRVSRFTVLSLVRVLGIADRRARTDLLSFADPPATCEVEVMLRAPPGKRLPALDVPADDPARRGDVWENCSCRRLSRFSSRVRAGPPSPSLSSPDVRLLADEDAVWRDDVSLVAFFGP